MNRGALREKTKEKIAYVNTNVNNGDIGPYIPGCRVCGR
jgi:hypothetical protein